MNINTKCGKIGKIFNSSFPDFSQEGGSDGKVTEWERVRENICQRKDGTYTAGFINRFGKRQTVYRKH